MRYRGLLLDTDYVTVEGRAWVRLWLQTKGGFVFLHDHSFEPYFYAVPEAETDPDELAAAISAESAGEASVRRAEVVERLKQTSSNQGAFDPVMGYGIVDADAATR